MPLTNLIRDTAHAVVEALGLEQKEVVVEGLATRWQRGTLFMQPADRPSRNLSDFRKFTRPGQSLPAVAGGDRGGLETFFHKIVMIRNNLRVLEQKVNASDKLSEADTARLRFL
jgi:hypothetical protein